MKVNVFKTTILLFMFLFGFNAYAIYNIDSKVFDFKKEKLNITNIKSSIEQDDNYITIKLNGNVNISDIQIIDNDEIQTILDFKSQNINYEGFSSFILSQKEITTNLKLSSLINNNNFVSEINIDNNNVSYISGNILLSTPSFVFNVSSKSNISKMSSILYNNTINTNKLFPYEIINNNDFKKLKYNISNIKKNTNDSNIITNIFFNFDFECCTLKENLDNYKYFYIVCNPIKDTYLCSNSIDFDNYKICNHNYIIDYSVINKSGHSMYCSKCKWNKVMPHNYVKTYDGILNNQCECGINKHVNIVICDESGNIINKSEVNAFSKIDNNIKESMYKNNYNITSFDYYEYVPKNKDYGNNTYNWEYIGKISNLPEKVNNISMEFIPHYEEIKTNKINDLNDSSTTGGGGSGGTNNIINNEITIDDIDFSIPDLTSLTPISVEDNQFFGASPTNYEEIDLSENNINPPEHIHRYVDNYDKNENGYHYKKCSICGVINENTKKLHNFKEIWACYNQVTKNSEIYGENGNKGYKCYPQNTLTLLCEDCGYSYTGTKDNHEVDSSTFHCEPSKFAHYYSCNKCHYPIVNGESCYYIDTNGKKVNILCGTGTCAVCGYTYTDSNHSLYIANGDIQNKSAPYKCLCRYCKKEFCNITNYSKTLSGNNLTISFNVNITDNKLKIYNSWKLENDRGLINTYTKSFENISETVKKMTYNINVNGTIDFLANNRGALSKILDLNSINDDSIMMYDNNHIQIDEGFLVDNTIIFDIEPPKVNTNDITVSDIQKKTDQSGNIWIIQQTYNIKGSDNLSSIVNLIIEIEQNGKKQEYYRSNLIIDDSHNFATSITPSVEATSGNIIFTFTDNSGNKTVVTKAITNNDNYAPLFKNNSDYTTPWTKEKIIEVITEDNGSGNVEITLNNKNNFSVGTKNGSQYTKKYKITGDIYNEINPILYAKDDLLNLSYQQLKVNKIDNTKPTITNITQTKNEYGKTTITITGHDKHNTKGTGSGISKYAVVKKGIVPADSDFSISAIHNNNTFLGTKELSFFGSYDVYAKDLVGNVSNVYNTNIDVDIKYNIKCKYTSENETKEILLKNIIYGQDQNLPTMYSLPITEQNNWKFNEIIVNSTKDLDKYITKNDETITIIWSGNNAYEKDNYNNITYKIKCEYKSETATKSILIENVKIGEEKNFPMLKVLPITSNSFGWYYKNLKVLTTLDLDKYVKNNNEIITIQYNTDGINAYADDIDDFIYTIKCNYWQETATKSILLQNVVIGTKRELPQLKILPITKQGYGWYINNIKVNNSLDVDQFVIKNNDVITIEYKLDDGASAYADDIKEFIYTIKCDYWQETATKSTIIKNVKIGSLSELPKIKILPITKKGYGWFYNENKVSSSLDVDQYVQKNNEIITLNYKTDDNARCYTEDVLNFRIKYNANIIGYGKVSTISTIEFGKDEKLLKLEGLPDNIHVVGWYRDDKHNIIKTTGELEQYITKNNQIIQLYLYWHFPTGVSAVSHNSGKGDCGGDGNFIDNRINDDDKKIIDKPNISSIDLFIYTPKLTKEEKENKIIEVFENIKVRGLSKTEEFYLKYGIKVSNEDYSKNYHEIKTIPATKKYLLLMNLLKYKHWLILSILLSLIILGVFVYNERKKEKKQ